MKNETFSKRTFSQAGDLIFLALSLELIWRREQTRILEGYQDKKTKGRRHAEQALQE